MTHYAPAAFVALGLLASAAQRGEAQMSQATMHHTKAGDIVDVAVAAGSFNTLATALKAAGLVETLRGAGPFTVFAPTDEAFAKLPTGTLDALLKDTAKLTAVLTYHVVPGKVMAADVVTLTAAKTANGASLAIRVDGGSVYVDDAKVLKADVPASNGVIHVIDTVILPKSQEKKD